MKKVTVFDKGLDNLAMLEKVKSDIREALKDGKRVKVEVSEDKSSRSLAQNRLLWLWLGVLSDYMAEHYDLIATSEDWLDVLAERNILPKVVNPLTKTARRKSTASLNTKEFTDFLERLELYCGKYHSNLELPKPEDLYYQAMSRGQ